MVVSFVQPSRSLLSGCVTLFMVFVMGHIGGSEPWTHHPATFLAVRYVCLVVYTVWSLVLDGPLAGHSSRRAPVFRGRMSAATFGPFDCFLCICRRCILGCVRQDPLGCSRLGGMGRRSLMYLYFGSDYPGAWFDGPPWLRHGLPYCWSTVWPLVCGFVGRPVSCPARYIFSCDPVHRLARYGVLRGLHRDLLGIFLDPKDVHRSTDRLLV